MVYMEKSLGRYGRKQSLFGELHFCSPVTTSLFFDTYHVHLTYYIYHAPFLHGVRFILHITL
jgi:hypothetical protein